MNIYKLTPIRNAEMYDCFDSVVVAAENEHEAKKIHPLGFERAKLIDGVFHHFSSFGVAYACDSLWALKPDMVDAEFIGVADKKYTEPTIICSSYNPG